MKWNQLSVHADAGIQEGLPCSVCGKMETGILYSLVNFTDEQAKWIETI